MLLLIVSISVSENAIIRYHRGSERNKHFVNQAMLFSERLSFLCVGLGLIYEANVSIQIQIHIHQSTRGSETYNNSGSGGLIDRDRVGSGSRHCCGWYLFKGGGEVERY